MGEGEFLHESHWGSALDKHCPQESSILPTRKRDESSEKSTFKNLIPKLPELRTRSHPSSGQEFHVAADGRRHSKQRSSSWPPKGTAAQSKQESHSGLTIQRHRNTIYYKKRQMKRRDLPGMRQTLHMSSTSAPVQLFESQSRPALGSSLLRHTPQRSSKITNIKQIT